jgi:hypothetical protein
MAGETGPWQTRVSFAPDGSFAYRPGEVLVRGKGGTLQKALEVLYELERQDRQLPELSESEEDRVRQVTAVFGELETISDKSSFYGLTGISDTLEAIRKLNQSGVFAQPNHVVFSHTSPGAGADGFQANPFYANPFYANPFYANPFYANPFYANPFYANPFYANPFYANPFYANPNPAAHPSFRENGRRPNSARPADEDAGIPFDPRAKHLFAKSCGGKGEGVKVAVLDTAKGIVGSGVTIDVSSLGEVADLDAEGRGYLDPVAGHGSFIGGIIQTLAPKSTVQLIAVITSYGDGEEAGVVKALDEDLDDSTNLVNLSFGGYSPSGMGALGESITRLHHEGKVVVASAGNDGTSVPMYPAVLPHVVAVGALDHEGNPAPFTNYGPWVRACTVGVEVTSTFFRDNLAHQSQATVDVDKFKGRAVWSGTSFAAPIVVAALAQTMSNGDSQKAVKQLVDGITDQGEVQEDLKRIEMLGTVVKPHPPEEQTGASA